MVRKGNEKDLGTAVTRSADGPVALTYADDEDDDVNEVTFAFLEGTADDASPHVLTEDIELRTIENGHSAYFQDGGSDQFTNGDSKGVDASFSPGESPVPHRRGSSRRSFASFSRRWFGGSEIARSSAGGVRSSIGTSEDRRQLARVILFLILLGIIPSAIIFLIDISVHAVFNFRTHLADGGGVRGFTVYVVGGVSLCLCGTLVCRLWSREAEGSGIPQMKAIMSGFYDRMKPALSLWTLLAKSVGLICVIGGGLPVGWEGPNVHISCIVAHHLSRLPGFRMMRKNRALRMQFMLCACSVGLASSFGTPIGGVLYALETTGSFYLVPTFWKSVLATIAGSLVYDILYKTPLVEAFENTSFVAGDYMRKELLAFAVMGVMMGLTGAFFVKCVYWVYFARKQRMPGTSRYVIVGIVSLLAAVLQYPLRLFRLDPRQAINEFFSASNLEVFTIVDMLLLVFVKFPLIAVSIGLPVPAGVFIPCFLLGSGLGRLYGELLRLIFGSIIVPGGYAVVGAAAFTAGVTRALSCAVVIFEVTGQLKHMVPTLVAVLISVITANYINRSLYDALIIMKQLPYMPHMRKDRSPRRQTAGDIMRRDVVVIPAKSKVSLIRSILDRHGGWTSFPVVTSAREMHVIGAVRRRSLVELLARCDDEVDETRNTTVDIKEISAKRTTQEEATLEDINRGPVVEGDIAQESTFSGEEQNDRRELLEDRNGEANDQDVDQTSRDHLPTESVDKECTISADLSPLIVTDGTLLSQLHFMFVMLMPTHALVTAKGSLIGIVTRRDIVQNSTEGGSRQIIR